MFAVIKLHSNNKKKSLKENICPSVGEKRSSSKIRIINKNNKVFLVYKLFYNCSYKAPTGEATR